MERMQSLIVDWNQKKATDSRNMSPFGGSQVLAGLQSPLGASFELKKRGSAHQILFLTALYIRANS